METRRNYRALKLGLARVRLAWRVNAATQGLLILLCVVALPLVIGAAAGAVGWWRIGVLCVSAAGGIVVLFWRVLFPLLRPLRLRDVSLLIERRQPHVESRLTSAVELWPEISGGQQRHEPTMLAALMAQAAADARKTPLCRALNLKATGRAGLATVGAFAVCAACFAARPAALTRLPQFVKPPYLPRQIVYAIEWVSGDVVIPVGSPVEIRARLSGDIEGAPEVVLEREGLEPSRESMQRVRGLEYNLKLSSVDGDTSFTVIYKDKRSKKYRITTVDPPRVRLVSTKLTYPKHTGMPPERRENAGDIMAPYGTVVELEVASSSPLSEAHLLLNGNKFPLKLKGADRAMGTLRVTRDTSYTVHLADRHGFPNRLPPEYSIRSIPDAPPEIELLQPTASMSVPRAVIVLLKGSARDDYGVSAVTLHYSITDTKKGGAVRIPVRPGPDVSFELPWDLTRVQAFAGQTIEFYVSATDNDDLTGPKSARTPTLRISILAPAAEYKQLEQNTDEIIGRLASTVGESQKIADTFKSLSQTLSDKDSTDWKKSEDVQRALDQQKDVESELADISQRMQENIDHMQNNEYVNLDTLDKMNQINELMKNILNDDMKKLIDKIQKNIESVDLSKLDRQLLETMKDQQKLLANLENTLQRLKRIQAEQKLDAAAKRLQDLVDRQAEVIDQSKQLKDKQSKSGLSDHDRQQLDQLSREEKDIDGEIAEQQQKLGDLQKDLSAFDESAAADLDKLMQDAKKNNLSGNLQSASQRLQQEKMPGAVQNEEDAYESMLALTRGLQDMKSQMGAKMSAQEKAMLMRALRKTLDLSQAQEDTLKLAGRLNARPFQKLSADETDQIRSGIQFQRDVAYELSADLNRLAGISMFVPPGLAGDALDAAKQLDQGLELLKQERTPDVYMNVSSSYVTLNRIALALLDAKAGGEGGSGQGEMEKFMQQLQSLADSQESLNSLTQQLGSSGLPMPAMMSGMQSLAVQQKMIGEGLSKLASESKNMSEMSQRLNQLQDEMENIQKSLAGGDAGREVQRRQSEVLRRMKDASLSLRKEVFEDQRTSEVGKEYAPATPQAAPGAKGSALPEDVLLELDSLRKESKIKGFENAIDSYYRNILAPK